MTLGPGLCVAGRDLTEPRPSPDATRVAFLARWGPAAAIVLVPLAGGPERLLTTLPAPAPGRGLGGGCFDWTPAGDAVVYVASDGELWWQPIDGATPTRITTHGPERVARAPIVSPDGAFAVYVLDEAEVWRCWLDRSQGPERLDDGSADFCFDPFVTPCGSTAMWQAWNVPDMPWDGAFAQRVTFDGLVRDEHRPAGALQQPRTMPDGSTVFVCDGTGWANVWLGDAPLVAEACEHAGPSWGMGQRSFAVSPDGARVAFTRNERGFGRLCVVDVATGGVAELGRGVHGQLGWVADRIVAVRSGARTPTEVVAYDASTGDRTVLAVGPVLGWSAVELPEPDLVEVVAPDGAVLHARRYVAGRGRTLCWVHGGPTDQWPVAFLPRVAYWWAQGWDVLVVDHRGSTGHGRAYMQALHGEWGRLDAADTATIVAHSHAAGWSTPQSTVMVGGSAGGLTVLAVLGRHRRLAAAGVVSYPVTDLADLAARSHRFEAHATVGLVGPPADAELYRERSPLTYADRIDVPLLVLHGRDDPVVPVEQSIGLAERVIAAGGDVELHLFDGEGHGFRQPANQVAEYELMATFLERVVG